MNVLILILVHTGQNYDYNLNEIFFDDLQLRKPDLFFNIAGKNLGESIGNVISSSYNVFLKEKPDALIVLGDTNSVLCTIFAKKIKNPIFIWKQEIDVLIRMFQRKLIEKFLITFRILI